ncbi:MAG: dTDP-4-dehydrorhamnose reductase [Rhodospirillales bacterium]|nr:dTDP-4-dehydrorhamnose reductase [Rhodospirillales bacterium]
MHVLIFGKAGQVARELGNLAWPATWRSTLLGRDDCDLMLGGSAAAAIATHKPDLVINAAAYTAVDKAESDRAAAFRLNADAPGEMAAATAAVGIPFLHISTDYVFDGKSDRPYRETDPCAPLSAYGASKLAGEIGIRQYQPRHIILRTAWVFSPYGANFVRTMLRLGGERDELAVVGDQIGGPTAAADIARTLARIAQAIGNGADAFGTYHYAGMPFISWHGFALGIFARMSAAGMKVPNTVREITTAEYPTAAPRPGNSRLGCGAISKDWDIDQPSWEDALDHCLATLLPVPLNRDMR